MNLEFLPLDFVYALIGGFFALAGVIVSNRATRKTARYQEMLRLLAEFYAEVFSAYTAAAPFRTYEKNMAFQASAEKAKLFCSAESARILTDLQNIIVSGHPSTEECGALLAELRESAKKDLRKN